MSLLINLALLVLGCAATLTAFGGETWRQGELPLSQRITRRGWLSLLCMGASLALGAAREIRDGSAAATAAATQQRLQAKLDTTGASLDATRRDLAEATSELQATKSKLAAVEPDILNAMIVATAGIRRESDFATPSIEGQAVKRILSGRTGGPLKLYGGDLVDYHVFCSEGSSRTSEVVGPGSPESSGLKLRIGNTDYSLGYEGRQMIIGPVGVPLDAFLVSGDRLMHCQLKLLIESADRTREANQVKPLIKMIRDAKSGTATKP
jgi:hypothetical protein